MLRQLFYRICKLFGKNDRIKGVETAAMVVVVLSIMLSHILFIVIIFEFEMTFLVEQYGFYLLLLSVSMFSYLYFRLVKLFMKYAVE
jgi:hypothetical protein